MRISDWSSDVCSSDLTRKAEHEIFSANLDRLDDLQSQHEAAKEALTAASESLTAITADREQLADQLEAGRTKVVERSEEHTSELQSLMRISYAVFCLKKKNITQDNQQTRH